LVVFFYLIMSILTILFLIPLILYIVIISSYIFGFYKLKQCNIQNTIIPEEKKYLTLIIPFKNEEEHLNALIESIKNQTLNTKYFEVILIDDHSVDLSFDKLDSQINQLPNIKLIKQDISVSGKKQALIKGIRLADSDLIVTSDADCVHDSMWLETILHYYLSYNPKMIIAPVLMKGNSLFQKFQSLDYLSLTAATAGSAGIKHPIMCSGANLSYRKDLFFEFSDAMNLNYQSGDDMFFLHSVKKYYRKEIHYLKSKTAGVYTEAEKSFNTFCKQRIRWSSKSTAYKDFDTIFSSLVVFGLNLLLIILLILSFINAKFFFALIIIYVSKLLVDSVLLIISARYFNFLKLLRGLPLLSIIYPFYIISAAIAGFLTKSK